VKSNKFLQLWAGIQPPLIGFGAFSTELDWKADNASQIEGHRTFQSAVGLVGSNCKPWQTALFLGQYSGSQKQP
jgi:hypothetical protein